MVRRSIIALFIFLLIGLSSANAAPRYSVTDGLVAYWKLNETSGVRYDSHSNYDLSDENTVGYTATGKINNAASFVSANGESLSFPDNDAFSSQSFSVGGWVNLRSKSSAMYIASKYLSSQREWGLRYSQSTDRYEFFIEPSPVFLVKADNFGSPVTNTWTFIVATLINSSQISITINAGVANTTSVSAALANRDWIFRIGGVAEGSSFGMNGEIDEMFFFSRALSMDEIQIIYNSGAGCQYEYLNSNCLVPTATPTNAPTNAPTNTPTNTPLPTATNTPTPAPTATPLWEETSTLDSGEVLLVERRITFGDVLVLVGLLGLAIINILVWVEGKTRILG